MGREERARNLALAERHRDRVDKKEIRFRKRLEDRFIEQTAAKARAVWDVDYHRGYSASRVGRGLDYGRQQGEDMGGGDRG